MTLKNLPSAISSQGLEDGALQLDLLAGQTTDPCGQVAHPASHSQQQATGKDKMTSDTSGQSSSISSISAALQSSLENRLRQRLEWAGSTIYKLTWKEKTTPAGWSYCQRAASVPRTKETDSSTSPSAWPTPQRMDGERGPVKGGLNEKGDRVSKDGVRYGKTLVTVAHQVSGWTTPNTRDWKDTPGMSTDRENNRQRIDQTPRQAFQLIGVTPTTPNLGTENTARYQLNPRFSLWLMGYPIEWAYCGERVTPSSRKSERR